MSVLHQQANRTEPGSHCPVTVIMTVKDDAAGCIDTLRSLREQRRGPDQVIVVDGGSPLESLEPLRAFCRQWPCMELIVAPGANIARGRNIATSAASHDIIACTDAGCRASDGWLAELLAPFERDASVQFVGGNYVIEPRSLFEQVVGLATMRGQLEPINSAKFNPSARSLAYRREVWRQAGGWPEWIRYSEDTLFDERIRQLGIRSEFASKAVVHWRPRTSWRALARQFYNYGTGRGHTQMGRADFLYNLRNLGLLAVFAAASLWSWWFIAFLAAHSLYFYLWAFHAKSLRIAKHTGRPIAYPLSLAVHWVVLISHLIGFLVGSTQRWLDKPRYEGATDAYLTDVSNV